jgi:dCTP deaminase
MKDKATSLEVDEDGCFHLEPRKLYLLRLDPILKLPGNITGRATGKSSVGRLDIITRLITNHGSEYDVVRAGYEGELHLLVAPQTFHIRVKPGKSLNQLRLFSGPPQLSVISREESLHYGKRFWYIPEGEDYVPWESIVSVPDTEMTADPCHFDLTVELADREWRYVYEALTDVPDPLRLDALDESCDPSWFFRKVAVEGNPGEEYVVLETGRFYIMKSRERLAIPDDVAVEVIAISERIGDIRIHYAGFAHPGFGTRKEAEGPDQPKGAPLIFEVRATDFPTRLYNQSLLARIQLFRMSGNTEPEKSTYDGQELKLSKLFGPWPTGRS